MCSRIIDTVVYGLHSGPSWAAPWRWAAAALRSRPKQGMRNDMDWDSHDRCTTRSVGERFAQQWIWLAPPLESEPSRRHGEGQALRGTCAAGASGVGRVRGSMKLRGLEPARDANFVRLEGDRGRVAFIEGVVLVGTLARAWTQEQHDDATGRPQPDMAGIEQRTQTHTWAVGACELLFHTRERRGRLIVGSGRRSATDGHVDAGAIAAAPLRSCVASYPPACSARRSLLVLVLDINY